MAEKYINNGDNSTIYPDEVTSTTYRPEIGRDLCRVNKYEGEYGGYRIDILTENLNERDKVGFICTICEGIMKEATCISSSEEQFCSCCRNISIGNETSNVTVRKMISTLKCCCPLIERGCEWLGTLEDCEDHLDTCGYVYVSCKLTCGVVLRCNELEKHEKETCSQRVVKCDHCKKDYKSYKYNEHLNKCPKMKVPCDLCDTQITREDMPQHLKHDCGMVQETCQLGCGVKLTRNELTIHEKDTCAQRKITCEHCDISVKFCDNSRHLKECPKVKVPCDFCDTQITREDMPQHLKHDCDMVQETCQLGCGVKLTRNELKIHEKDTCVQRKITCEHCDISVKFCDFSEHLRECPNVKVTCDLCSIEKYRKDLTEHLKDYCPEKMLECPFLRYKCMTVMKRKDMDNHLEEKETKHLGLKLSAMEDLISKQNEKITKQNEKITEQSEEIKKVKVENKKQNAEIAEEKQFIRLLFSISDITTIICKIENVTGLMRGHHHSVSKQYQVAGCSCRIRIRYNRELSIVFPETTTKYDNPFIAKCHTALDASNIIDCGKIEVNQNDLTRGCERIFTTISQKNVDKYSEPRYPGDTQKHLTLWIYLTIQ